MEKYCSLCGKKLEEGMLICPQCGANQFKANNPNFPNKKVIGIITIISGAITSFAGLTNFFGSIVDFGFLAAGIGLIMTGILFCQESKLQ
ncbi:MAG: zinc-ribbon domain-containing protein [Ruminococcaceae bacterium]|nr:zinc-ribbon domain-containing protein [Oscillospiraceae bacterium]